MNVIANELYLNRVDRLMEKLRAACLGQDTCLLAALPTYLLTESNERKAAHLARQIVFALAAVSGEGTPELYQRSWEWMYGSILYLLRECNKTDQTFAEMVRLMKLSFEVRQILFCGKAESKTDYSALCEDKEMPEPLEDAEVAILCLMESMKLGERMKQRLAEVSTLIDTSNSLF